MGQGVANWKTERAESKGVQENAHLVPHSDRAVQEVGVIEAQAGVEEDLLDAILQRHLDLAREMFVHRCHQVSGEIEIADFTNVCSLDVADDHRRAMRAHHAKYFVGASGAGEIHNVRSGLE